MGVTRIRTCCLKVFVNFSNLQPIEKSKQSKGREIWMAAVA